MVIPRGDCFRARGVERARAISKRHRHRRKPAASDEVRRATHRSGVAPSVGLEINACEVSRVHDVGPTERCRAAARLARRSGKHTLYKIAQQLALHPGGLAGFVDMRLAILAALHQAFGVHVLQKLEHAGIADGPVGAETLVNLAHGGWTASPQDAENFDFGRRGFGYGFFCHAVPFQFDSVLWWRGQGCFSRHLFPHARNRELSRPWD